MPKLKEIFRRQQDGYENVGYSIFVDGVEVGEVGLLVDEKSAYLERIDIFEKYQNKGYGTKALYELKKIYGEFYLAPDNEDSKRLFEKLGRELNQRDYSAYGYTVDQGYGVYEI